MQIGFVGTGNIGQPMARRLLDTGHTLWVNDLRAELLAPLVAQGARAASLADIGACCDAVMLSLPSGQALRDVLAPAAGLTGGARLRYVVNTSTVGGPLVRELAALLQDYGQVLVDCPISGGPARALEGRLAVMVSGDPAAVAELRGPLEAWGALTVAGDRPGAAQLLKLTNNILSIVSMAASAEAMVLGAKGGLDPEVMLAAINGATGRSGATEEKVPNYVLTGSFRMGSALSITLKDGALALAEAEALGVPMTVCQAAREAFRRVAAAVGEEADTMSIYRAAEEAAGFAVPRTRAAAAGQ